MNNLADRIAKLPPEKRALLIAKLAEHRTQGSEVSPEQPHTPNAILEAENFCCSIATPGNVKSIRFREIARTPPGPGQVQVKARAFSLNFRDLMIAMNMYPPTPGVPSIMGSDYAGDVLACGDGVDDFKPGDEVIALSAGCFAPGGGLLEDHHFCAISNISARQAVHKPELISYEQGAGVPTVFLTSYYALCHIARLRRGERVLIHSATGGVGLAAIQIAQWVGAEIFATAGTEEKREFLKSLGIEHRMDSRSVDFAEEIMEATDGEGVDVILNTLSGEAMVKGMEILRVFGRFLQIDKQDISRDSSLSLGLFRSGLSFSAIDISLFLMQPDRLKKLLLEITDHLRSEHFRPTQFTAYPIAQLSETLTLMSRSIHIGKLVLTYGQ